MKFLAEARFGHLQSNAEALSYDAVYALADAVRRAGSFDPARIRDALAATRDLPGVAGSLSFDAKRNAVKPVVIVRYGPNGANYVGAFPP